MGLDIRIMQRHTYVCGHCGEIVGERIVEEVKSGGRAWYPFLESVGYYVPHDKLTPGNDWYGKDMPLTKERAERLYRYCKEEEVYNRHEVIALVATAMAEGDAVVINADW